MQDEEVTNDSAKDLTRPQETQSPHFSFTRPATVIPAPRRPLALRSIDFDASIPGLNKSSRPIPLFGSTFSGSASLLSIQDSSSETPGDEKALVAGERKDSTGAMGNASELKIDLQELEHKQSLKETQRTLPDKLYREVETGTHFGKCNSDIRPRRSIIAEGAARLGDGATSTKIDEMLSKQQPASKEASSGNLKTAVSENTKQHGFLSSYTNPFDHPKPPSTKTKRSTAQQILEQKKKVKRVSRPQSVEAMQISVPDLALQTVLQGSGPTESHAELNYVQEMHNLRAKVSELQAIVAVKSDELLTLRSAAKRSSSNKEELLLRVGQLEADLKHSETTAELNVAKHRSMSESLASHHSTYLTITQANSALRQDLTVFKNEIADLKGELASIARVQQSALSQVGESQKLIAKLRTALSSEQVRSETLSSQCDRDAGLMAEDRGRITYLLEQLQRADQDRHTREVEDRAELKQIIIDSAAVRGSTDLPQVVNEIKTAIREQFSSIKQEVGMTVQAQQRLMSDLGQCLVDHNQMAKTSQGDPALLTTIQASTRMLEELLPLKTMIAAIEHRSSSAAKDELKTLQSSFETCRRTMEDKIGKLTAECSALKQELQQAQALEDSAQLELDSLHDQLEKQKLQMEMFEAKYEANAQSNLKAFEEERAKFVATLKRSREAELMQLENQLHSRDSRLSRLEQELETARVTKETFQSEISQLRLQLQDARKHNESEATRDAHNKTEELQQICADRDSVADELVLLQQQFAESQIVIAALKEALAEKKADYDKLSAQVVQRFSESNRVSDTTGDIYDFIHDTPPVAPGRREDIVDETQDQDLIEFTQPGVKTYHLREEPRAESRSGSRARGYKKRKSK